MEANAQEITVVPPYTVKLKTILEAPDIMDRVFLHIANGGDLITFCQNLDIRYSDIAEFINKDMDRIKRYSAAVKACEEWIRRRILNELAHIGLVDIRGIFNESGRMRPPGEWPEDIARAIAGVEIEDDGSTKVKLTDKIKALELIGKEMGMFVQRHAVEVKTTLEDLVSGSMGT